MSYDKTDGEGGFILKCEEAIYNLSILAQCNYHIHTNFSECAYPEMTLKNIIDAAERANLTTIALVDHHHVWTKGILEVLNRLKGELQSIQTSVKVHIGAELSAYGVGKYSDAIELNGEIDYRVYACNHYHLNFWEHPKTIEPRAYAEHTLHIIEDLIKSGRADCIAHPFVGTYLRDKVKDYTMVTSAISDNELGDILELGKNHNIAWEINKNAFMDDPDFARRYYDTGKEVGVTFRFGTDAHTLGGINPKPFIDKLESIIHLKK